MPIPHQPSPQESGVRISFLRCPACSHQPVTFLGVRLGAMALSCERCRNEWTRADRRSGGERRLEQRPFELERREAQRRGGDAAAPRLTCPECWRASVKFLGITSGSMTLACEHCRHQWTRADRRAGVERRQELRTVVPERRRALRRLHVLDGLVPQAPLHPDASIASRPLAPSAIGKPGVPGSSINVKGEVVAESDLVIVGCVVGRISVPNHTVTVAADAYVAAAVEAMNVIVLGSVTGTVTATARITIEAGAHVIADLVAPVLVLTDGAEFTGRVEIGEVGAKTN